MPSTFLRKSDRFLSIKLWNPLRNALQYIQRSLSYMLYVHVWGKTEISWRIKCMLLLVPLQPASHQIRHGINNHWYIGEQRVNHYAILWLCTCSYKFTFRCKIDAGVPDKTSSQPPLNQQKFYEALVDENVINILSLIHISEPTRPY